MNSNDNMLWMGDLESYMDSEFITEAFRKMGSIIKTVKVVHDKYSGREAGYCFLELDDGDSARQAMLNVNGKVVPNSKPPVTFNLSFANSPSNPYTEYNLFVNNVSEDLDDAGLFLVFGERYRSCRGAKVYRNSDGSSRGAGFVRFADQTDQQRALVEMNKHVVDGKPLYLKLAQPKFRAPRGGPSATARASQPNYDPQPYYQNTYGDQFAPAHFAPPPMQHPPPMQYQPMFAPQQPPMQYVHQQPAPNMIIQDTRHMQQQPQPAPQPQAPAAPVAPVDPETLPEMYVDEMTAEQLNYVYMQQSEEWQHALDESRWAPVMIVAGTCERDLA